MNEFAPADNSTPAPPSNLRRVFIGADGLRAGWSLLIFIALMAAILFSVRAISNKLHPQPHEVAGVVTMVPSSAATREAVPLLATLLVTWIMSLIEKRPNGVYGLGGQRKLPYLIAGLVSGIACLSLLILVLWKTGFLAFNSRLLFGESAFRYGVIWLCVFALVALLEEYLTRGYLLFTLARGLGSIYGLIFKSRHSAALGFWTAALLLSLLFGLGHNGNPGESPIGLLSAGLASLVFCLSLWRTGSLWWAIGFHATWDWGQSFLYGVADSGVLIKFHLLDTHPIGKPILSGGTTGPEGSIFILAILALIAILILFTLPRTAYALPVQFPGAPVPNEV